MTDGRFTEPVPEERTPSLLEQRLQVARKSRDLSVGYEIGTNDLSVWRPLVQAAQKSHQGKPQVRGRGRRRRGSGRRRAMFLWRMVLVLMWAIAAAGLVMFLLNGRQI